jgi:hypothetical protein
MQFIEGDRVRKVGMFVCIEWMLKCMYVRERGRI